MDLSYGYYDCSVKIMYLYRFNDKKITFFLNVSEDFMLITEFFDKNFSLYSLIVLYLKKKYDNIPLVFCRRNLDYAT